MAQVIFSIIAHNIHTELQVSKGGVYEKNYRKGGDSRADLHNARVCHHGTTVYVKCGRGARNTDKQRYASTAYYNSRSAIRWVVGVSAVYQFLRTRSAETSATLLRQRELYARQRQGSTQYCPQLRKKSPRHTRAQSQNALRRKARLCHHPQSGRIGQSAVQRN